MTEGIQYWCAVATVAAESKMVPDWTTTGVPPLSVLRIPFNSYQRDASRFVPEAPVVPPATPEALTPMLCADQSRPLRMCAAKRRSSRASTFEVVLPRWSTLIGSEVVLTVIRMLEEMV